MVIVTLLHSFLQHHQFNIFLMQIFQHSHLPYSKMYVKQQNLLLPVCHVFWWLTAHLKTVEGDEALKQHFWHLSHLILLTNQEPWRRRFFEHRETRKMGTWKYSWDYFYCSQTMAGNVPRHWNIIFYAVKLVEQFLACFWLTSSSFLPNNSLAVFET